MNHICEFKFNTKWKNGMDNRIYMHFHSIADVYTAGDMFSYQINLSKIRVFPSDLRSTMGNTMDFRMLLLAFSVSLLSHLGVMMTPFPLDQYCHFSGSEKKSLMDFETVTTN